MQAKVLSFENKTLKNKILPERIFNQKRNDFLLAQTVRIFLANQRKSKAKVKSRGEVSGSGKKIYRQKGTGRARHGDRYAPIFVGGGVAHGPDGTQNWELNLPKKLKKQALRVTLSKKLKEDKIFLIDNFAKAGTKTKLAEQKLLKILTEGFGLDFKPKSKKGEILLVFEGKNNAAVLPFRNLSWVRTVTADNLNPYSVLRNKFVIFELPALEKLIGRLSDR